MGKSTFLVRQRQRPRCEAAPLIVKLLRAAYHGSEQGLPNHAMTMCPYTKGAAEAGPEAAVDAGVIASMAR